MYIHAVDNYGLFLFSYPVPELDLKTSGTHEQQWTLHRANPCSFQQPIQSNTKLPCISCIFMDMNSCIT